MVNDNCIACDAVGECIDSFVLMSDESSDLTVSLCCSG